MRSSIVQRMLPALREIDPAATVDQASACVGAAWTPGMIRRVAALARWAVDRNTGVAQMVSEIGRLPGAGRDDEDLDVRVFRLLEATWQPTETAPDLVAPMLAWLALFVAAHTWHAANLVHALVTRAFLAEDETWLRWVALGPAGRLAYAAGLSLDEAEARSAVGTLDPLALQALAGVRGWRLPVEPILPSPIA